MYNACIDSTSVIRKRKRRGKKSPKGQFLRPALKTVCVAWTEVQCCDVLGGCFKTTTFRKAFCPSENRSASRGAPPRMPAHAEAGPTLVRTRGGGSRPPQRLPSRSFLLPEAQRLRSGKGSVRPHQPGGAQQAHPRNMNREPSKGPRDVRENQETPLPGLSSGGRNLSTSFIQLSQRLRAKKPQHTHKKTKKIKNNKKNNSPAGIWAEGKT